jgi:hypothetical protein
MLSGHPWRPTPFVSSTTCAHRQDANDKAIRHGYDPRMSETSSAKPASIIFIDGTNFDRACRDKFFRNDKQILIQP